MTYTQARKDFETLEAIVELDDWVELQGDLLELMHNPTKAMATTFYERAIGLWFNENTIKREDVMNDSVRKIRDRY